MWTLETVRKIEAVRPEVWFRVLRLMLLARRVDEQLIKFSRQGRIRGSAFTGIGREAIGAAAAVASRPDDLFAPCIRNLSLHLGRGETPLGIFRQSLGRAQGPTGGRDGNIHHGNLDNGVFAMISHLGAMISVVTGGVMARRRQGMDTVGVAFVGDGARLSHRRWTTDWGRVTHFPQSPLNVEAASRRTKRSPAAVSVGRITPPIDFRLEAGAYFPLVVVASNRQKERDVDVLS